MLSIKYLSGEIFITINDFNNDISYEEMKILFDSNIIIEQYYMLTNNDENIYTNLYDIYEMKYRKNIILNNNLNIIILPYKKIDVKRIKNNARLVELSESENIDGYLHLDIHNFPSKRLKSDKLFVLMAINISSKFYKYISKDLQEDFDIIDIIYRDLENLDFIPQKCRDSKEFIKEFINKYGDTSIMSIASDNLRNDTELIYMAINSDGESLKYINEFYRDNEEIVRIAIKEYPSECYEYISERLRNKKEIIMECINILKLSNSKYYYEHNNILRNISNINRSDKEIVLPLLEMNKRDFKYVSEELKKDKEFILTYLNIITLSNDYDYKDFLLNLPHFNNDKEIVLASIKKHDNNIFYMSNILKQDKDFLLLCLNIHRIYNHNYEYFYINDLLFNFRDDKEIVLAILKKYGSNIKYVSDRLKKDKDVILTAIVNCYYEIDKTRNSNSYKFQYLQEKNIKINNILNEVDICNISDPSILQQIILLIK